MSSDWPQTRAPGSSIQPCSACGTPPAASVQVGGGTTVFWFECKTCGKRSSVLASFEEARQAWNSLQ